MDQAFDVTFDAVMAWNQIGLMAGGMVMLLIGGLLVFWFFHTRLTFTRVKGKVVAVRATGIGSNDEAVQAAPPPEEKPEPSWEAFGEEFRKAPGTGLAALLIALMVVGIPLLFIGFGAYFAYDYMSLTSNGIQAEATVIDNVQERDSEGGYTYHAVVSFKDDTGKEWEVRDRFGKGGSPVYDEGEKVIVHYEPGNPEHLAVGGFWKNMLLPAAFAFMGALVLFFVFGGSAIFKGDADISALPKKRRADFAGEMYYPVFEYKARDGTMIRGEGNGGSNWLGDKMPGRPVFLYVKEGEPDNINTPGMLSLLFGLIFAVPGIAMIYISLTKFETTIHTALFGMALLVFLGFKIKKGIKPRSEWDNKESFKARRRAKREAKRSQGRLLTAQEIKERIRVQDRQAMCWVPVVGMLAVIMVAGGVYLGQDMKAFIAGASGAEGYVSRIESVYDSSSDGSGYMFYPVVRFVDAEGQEHEFRDKVGSNPSLYQMGDKVEVLYDPADTDHAIINRGLWNWMLAAGLSVAGLLLLWWTLKVSASVNSRKGRI